MVAYPVDDAEFWTPPDFWDAEDLAIEIGDHPCAWTDGSSDNGPTEGISVAGAAVYLPHATETDVEQDRVRAEDRIGNIEARWCC